jgi:hypothetical protein
MDKNVYKNINGLYDNLTYYDLNGVYMLITAIFSIIVILVFGYFHILNNIQPVRKNWAVERCNPMYIPFAGVIMGKSGKESLKFTEDNFSGCIQNILQGLSSSVLSPFYYIVDIITATLKDMAGYINAMRELLNKLRTALSGILDEVFKRINIFMIPIIQLVIVVKDTMSKTVGILTATLFTFFGAFYTLKSLVGSIFELLLKILGIIIAILVIFIALSFVPFVGFIGTIGALATIPIMMFVLIPIILTKLFMSDILETQGSGIPGIPSFCFAKETVIPLSNGETKQITGLNVGDELADKSIVTSILTLPAKGQDMYNLNGIAVTGRHRVLYCGYYIHVEYHPDAVKVKDFNDPFVYCFNTTSKKIRIGSHVFLDWDEIDAETRKLYVTKNGFVKNESGICGDTMIKLRNGTSKPLKDILIGDVLIQGETVTGLVKILASRAPNLLEYDLDGNKLILTSNLGFILQNSYLGKTPTACETPQTYLYHLLTDTFSFTIYDCVHMGEYS